jgi:hypothetical protein
LRSLSVRRSSLQFAVLALWARLANVPAARAALAGVNAGVVGILAAALYRPVLTSSIASGGDVAIALAALVLLLRWRVAPVLGVGPGRCFVGGVRSPGTALSIRQPLRPAHGAPPRRAS